MRLATWVFGSTAAILSIGCAEEAPPAEPAPRPVRTQRIEQRSQTQTTVLAGVARAGIESNLSFRVGGTVLQIPHDVGRRVRRGEVLGRLDPVDYELAVEEAEAALAQAEAALRRAIADYSRARALYENNNAAKSEFDAARAGFESAEAQVEAAKKRLAQAEQRLDYTTLRAPVDGAVASIPVDVNETVSGGQTVVRLTSGEAPEVEVGVAEVTIPFVRPGMDVEVAFDALPGKVFPGTVTGVGVATTQGSSTYPVVVRIDDPDGTIRSGMAAEVHFEFDLPSSDRVLLPAVAVNEDDKGRFVLVVEDAGDGEGVVRRRGVEVGQLRPDGIEVASGLSIGDVVVTAGVRRLRDGMRVRYTAGEDGSWM